LPFPTPSDMNTQEEIEQEIELDSNINFSSSATANSLYTLDDPSLRRSERIAAAIRAHELLMQEQELIRSLTLGPIQELTSRCRSNTHLGLPCAAISVNHAPSYYDSFRVKKYLFRFC
jgi:hypothetical protein